MANTQNTIWLINSTLSTCGNLFYLPHVDNVGQGDNYSCHTSYKYLYKLLIHNIIYNVWHLPYVNCHLYVQNVWQAPLYIIGGCHATRSKSITMKTLRIIGAILLSQLVATGIFYIATKELHGWTPTQYVVYVIISMYYIVIFLNYNRK